MTATNTTGTENYDRNGFLYEAPETFERRLIIYDKEKFNEAAAQNLPKGNRTLLDCVTQLVLGNYGKADTLAIGPDSVEHCFSFAFRKGGVVGLNGGIILHNAGVENFTITLDSTEGKFYGIHT